MIIYINYYCHLQNICVGDLGGLEVEVAVAADESDANFAVPAVPRGRERKTGRNIFFCHKFHTAKGKELQKAATSIVLVSIMAA